jgi:Zn-finger nucleic acid-binding protein
MMCENCGAPLRLSRDQGLMICDYCGSQTTPQTNEDGVLVLDPTKHNCPVCQTPLSNASIESHDLLYCTHCHGMLIDMDNFLPLLDVLREYRYWARSSQAPRAVDTGRILRCPLCQHEMDEHLYGGGGNMDVDSCEQCNLLWLDRGELSRIVSAPDRDPRAGDNWQSVTPENAVNEKARPDMPRKAVQPRSFARDLT